MSNKYKPKDTTSHYKSSSSPKHVVLVLEDDLLTRAAVSGALTHDGFSVLEAYTVSQAIEILKQERVDVMFADLNLPSDDEGLLAVLYAQVQQPGINVILTSARRRDRDDFLTGYFGPFVAKPYLLANVVRLVGELARERAATPAISSHPNPLPPILWESG